MSEQQQLHTIFQELDYLDDGYNDGFISHVGLRRIILETPELEAEVGSTFTRALLNRAEQNLYGRMTWDDFQRLYGEVAAYVGSGGGYGQGYGGGHHNGNNAVSPYGAGGGPANGQSAGGPTGAPSAAAAPGAAPFYPKSAPKTTINNAAVRLAIPVTERDDRLNYLDQYSCKPPPMFLFLISLVQIGIFIWHVIILNNRDQSVGPNGPPYVEGPLIFNPYKKWEVWRFLTYMLVHSGYFHIIFNLLIQLLLGIPLEMVHRWWRILLVYFSGVVAGSLATSISDPEVYLAGASGGVYAIIAAHLANVIFNWSEMEFPALRLIAFILLAGIDTGVAVYYRYIEVDTQVGYAAHAAGAIVGFLLGIVVLRNLRVHTWERVLWWICLLLFLALFLAAIVWNAVEIARFTIEPQQ